MRRRRRMRRRESGEVGVSFDQPHRDHSPLVKAVAPSKKAKAMKITLTRHEHWEHGCR